MSVKPKQQATLIDCFQNHLILNKSQRQCSLSLVILLIFYAFNIYVLMIIYVHVNWTVHYVRLSKFCMTC